MPTLVMTILSEDRPGLIGRISSVVADHRGNWLESRLSRLAGRFAGIVTVEVAEEQREALGSALEALETDGIHVTTQSSDTLDDDDYTCVRLDLVGQDQPGIVRKVSHALASHGVNVLDLHTEYVSAPMSAELLFKAEAELQLPEGLDRAALQADLEEIATDLMVDLTLE